MTHNHSYKPGADAVSANGTDFQKGAENDPQEVCQLCRLCVTFLAAAQQNAPTMAPGNKLLPTVRWIAIVLLVQLTPDKVVAQLINTDSIRAVIANTADPNRKIGSMIALFNVRQTLPADTFAHYVAQAKMLSKTHGSDMQKEWIEFYSAAQVMNTGALDSALGMLNRLLLHVPETPEGRGLFFRILFLRTNTFVRKNQFREALKEYYLIAREAEIWHDTMSLTMSRNGLGWVHMEMGQYRNALNWLHRALHTNPDPEFYNKYSFVYSNIASSYNSLHIADSSEIFAKLAIAGARKYNDLECLANSLNILSDTYIITNRDSLAEPLLQQAVAIRETIGDPYYVVSDMMQLAVFYAHHNEPAKGIAVSLKGIEMARQHGLTSKLPVLYDALAQNYRANGDYKNLVATLNKLIQIKDSVYKINSVDVMNEMQTRYELQLNENTIMRQKLALVEKGYWLNASLVVLLSAAIIGAILFNVYQKKNRLRMKWLVDSGKQSALLAVTEAEDNQRKRISTDLHDSLGVQANAILYGTELLQQASGNRDALITDLHDTAKDMLVTLRETLWAMKVNEATAAAIWLRVINFTRQLGRYYTSVNISTTGVVPAGFHLSAARSLNIVLILQEALNNSVRHSGARNISLASRDEEGAWTMTLEDDGRGFDREAEAGKRESYGLINMQARADNAGIQLDIITARDKGVRISLSISHNS